MALRALAQSMRRSWRGYEVAVKKNPFLTQAVSGGLIWAAGNAFAQKVVSTSEPGQAEFDRDELIRTTGYGVLCAPVGHWWYIGLDRVCTRTLQLRAGWKMLLVKLLADTFIFGAAHIAAFYAWSTVMAGGTLQEAVSKVKKKFASTFAADIALWVPAQVVNFTCVPPVHNMLFVNLFSIVEAALLSWIYDHDLTFQQVHGLVPGAKKAQPKKLE